VAVTLEAGLRLLESGSAGGGRYWCRIWRRGC